MRRALATALAALVLGAVPACTLPGSQVEDGHGLAGTYTLNGTDLDGSEFSGTVVITGTDEPATYEVRWLVTEALLEGTATRSGDEVDVTWHATAGSSSDARGTGRYEIDGDGNLDGSRTVDGLDGTIDETIYQEA
ncbi:MAG: hypothetical protein KDB04_09975 [Acidimicrobiales bacterium]|nr:hypothetical protein [Acidimicrobiales bacterium]HRW39588.1 hypothetical protein [Aquihabitans sp.]